MSTEICSTKKSAKINSALFSEVKKDVFAQIGECEFLGLDDCFDFIGFEKCNKIASELSKIGQKSPFIRDVIEIFEEGYTSREGVKIC